MANTPQLPPGFVLDDEIPPPPPGFQLDGAPDAQRAALIRARARGLDNINADPTADMSFLDQTLAGAGMWAADRVRGVGQRLGLRDGEDTAQQRALDAPLRDSPGGGYGEFAAPMAALLPAGGVRVLNTLRGAAGLGAGYGATEPTESAGETATNIGLGGLLGLGGQAAGNKLGQFIGNRINSREAAALGREEAGSVRDATFAAARAEGYITPPATANPSRLNATVETTGGKRAIEHEFSAHNQQVTNRLARQELGLPENAPLTPQSLGAVRNEAAQVYRQIESAGDIVPDTQYLDDLAGIEQTVARIGQDFPDLQIGARPEIRELLDGLLVDRFSARGAMELIRTLRSEASSLFRSAGMGSGNPGSRALAQATIDAADTVEEQVMRHLRANGMDEAADAFDAARRRIAISHTVENALNESTGDVIARRLAADLGRGKPLSGRLETAARFAQAAKNANRLPDSSPVSLVNAGVSFGAGGTALGMTGNPLAALAAGAAWPASRAGARWLARGPLQNNLRPNYAPNKLGTLMLEGGRYAARRGGPLAAVMAVNQ